MIRQFVPTVLIAGTLLLGLVTLSNADIRTPVSTSVVATVTAIDTHNSMATLKTENGEVYELPKDSLWQVGSKVECDRVEVAPSPQLQNCQPW